MLASSLLLLTVATAAPNVHPLRYHLVGDVVATGVGAAAWVATESVLKSKLAPDQCRWCDRAGLVDTLNPVDRFGRGLAVAPSSQHAMDLASSGVGFLLLPLVLVGTDALIARNDDALDGVGVDVLIAGEALVATLAFNQLIKFTVARERPFVHRIALGEASSTSFGNRDDDNVSFFSGHSSFAFALLAGMATVADLRGYSGAKWVWIIGAPLATAVPLMRMGADKHYLTDVATGAVIGTAFGVLLPRLLHGRADAPLGLSIAPAPNGIAVSGHFR